MSDEEWSTADEWASWMFPRAFLPRYEEVPKISTGFADAYRGPTLADRIQAYIDEVDPQKAEPRPVWWRQFTVQTPDETPDFVGALNDFTITVDNKLETEGDARDAAEMFLRQYDSEPEVRVTKDWGEVDWDQMAEDLKRNGPDWAVDRELYIHPSVFPGEARSLAEADALVGMRPEHETLEEMPGPCIMCGEDEVHVTVRRNPDGEIEETTLKCHACKWRVSGGPPDLDESNRLDRPDGEVDFFGDQA